MPRLPSFLRCLRALGRPSRVLAPSLVAPTLAVLALAADADAPGVAFPQDPTALRHVKSMVIQEGHPLAEPFGGIHHVYANEAAWAGLEEGRFRDGALLVFDLFEVRPQEHALVEGPRKVLAVMRRDAERFPDTGGWGFEAFAEGDPQRPTVDDPASECFACHTSQADHGYVFSRPRG
ncbi:MAG: cytochrome P460 family protein [Myxococcota bacterium]|nr:cytochrome P460 family protein [Myxococcota bacterium]